MMADIKLVATDLDGTLIGSVNELPLYTDFNDQINRLRQQHGTIWVACTGRKFSSFWDFFSPMRRMGLLPDYVVIRHALIYRHTWIGFIPHVVWNISILLRLWREGREADEAIDNWHETLTGGAVGVSTIRRTKNRLGLRFDSEESAVTAAHMLRERIRQYRHLQIYMKGSDLEIRTIPSTKGLALTELATYLNIERENMLAIGNGANDISMLDGSAAAMVGCPSNSDPEVIHTVHRAGGHVAPHRSLRGVMDVLEAYVEDTVCSDLPRDWSPGAVRPDDSPARTRKRSATGRQHKPRFRPWLFVIIGYAALLAFSCFDVIPYASRWIRLPMELLIGAFVKLFSWL